MQAGRVEALRNPVPQEPVLRRYPVEMEHFLVSLRDLRASKWNKGLESQLSMVRPILQEAECEECKKQTP